MLTRTIATPPVMADNLNQRRFLHVLSIRTQIQDLLETSSTLDGDVRAAVAEKVLSLVTLPRPQISYENADEVFECVSEITAMHAVGYDGVILFHDDDQVSLIDMTDTEIKSQPFTNTEHFKKFLAECALLDDDKVSFLASVVVQCLQKSKLSSTVVVDLCVNSMCPSAHLADLMKQSLHKLLQTCS